MYENSDIHSFAQMQFVAEIFFNLTIGLLGKNVDNTIESCCYWSLTMNNDDVTMT